jgi:hypothetical protein
MAGKSVFRVVKDHPLIAIASLIVAVVSLYFIFKQGETTVSPSETTTPMQTTSTAQNPSVVSYPSFTAPATFAGQYGAGLTNYGTTGNISGFNTANYQIYSPVQNITTTTTTISKPVSVQTTTSSQTTTNVTPDILGGILTAGALGVGAVLGLKAVGGLGATGAAVGSVGAATGTAAATGAGTTGAGIGAGTSALAVAPLAVAGVGAVATAALISPSGQKWLSSVEAPVSQAAFNFGQSVRSLLGFK